MKKFTLLLVFALIANVFLNSDLFGQIAQRGGATTANSTNTTLTINKPTGVVSGDVMIVNIAQRNSTGAPSLAGWTLISSGAIDGGSITGAVLYKVAGGSEPANYAFSLGSGANNTVGTIVAFSGVDVSGPTPFDVAPGSLSLSGANANSGSAASISTNTANAAVIMFSQISDNQSMGSWNTTDPGTLTELYESQYNGSGNNDLTVGAAWATKASIGATGSGTVGYGGSVRWGAILLALKRFIPPPAVTLTPSANQSIFTGSSVSFTATALNYPGSGNYTYTWSVSPSATIPGSNPNTIGGSSDTKAITFNNAGTYTVSVQISRGVTVLTTSSTTVEVYAPNLWSTAGTGSINKYTVNPVTGAVVFGPASVATPLTSTAALGKNQVTPNDPDGCLYYLNRDDNGTLGGVVSIYSLRPDGTGHGLRGTIDMNGVGNTTSFSFVRMGFDNQGRGWILAGSDPGGNIYIASFQGNGVNAISGINTFPSLSVAAPGTASEFQNGDLAISGNGTLYVVANVTNGQTYVYTLNSLNTPTTLTRKWTVQDNGGTFSGSVNGLAWTQSGSLHFSTSTGIYFIDQTTANTASGTVQASLITSISGLTDLASDRFPQQSTLPVTLGAFSVTKQGDFAVLNWKTSTEINTDHFEIERSYDGVNFTSVAIKAAAGNTSSDVDYQHSDPINYNYQIVYYRLKTVDQDTRFSYSKIVALRLSNGPIKNLTVFPNPFTTDLKLQISSLSETTGTVRISNAVGQVVYNRNIILQKGENIVVLTSGLETLKPGMHLMEVITAEGKVTQKIIKR